MMPVIRTSFLYEFITSAFTLRTPLTFRDHLRSSSQPLLKRIS